MKKIFTLVVSALLAGSAFAQDVPYILSAVGDNTYAVTMTLDDIKAKYDALWITDAWNMGAALPAGTVMFENDDLVISAAVDKTPVYTASGKIKDIMRDHPTYTGYVNLGSSLPQDEINKEGDNPEKYMTVDVADWKASNQGLVLVTPKKKGTLSFGVYAGNNKRCIGIYMLPTDEEVDNDFYGEWVSYNNFQNEDQTPAYVEGVIEPGHDFVLVGGGNKNLCLHEIKFVPAGSSSISSALTNGKAKVAVGYYNAAGVQVNGLQKGLNIVKYSDGTAAKIIK